MPMAGQPRYPKIMIGSRMIFVRAPDICVSMDRVVLPVDCSMRSNCTDMKTPKLKVVTMRR